MNPLFLRRYQPNQNDAPNNDLNGFEGSRRIGNVDNFNENSSGEIVEGNSKHIDVDIAENEIEISSVQENSVENVFVGDGGGNNVITTAGKENDIGNDVSEENKKIRSILHLMTWIWLLIHKPLQKKLIHKTRKTKITVPTILLSLMLRSPISWRKKHALLTSETKKHSIRTQKKTKKIKLMISVVHSVAGGTDSVPRTKIALKNVNCADGNQQSIAIDKNVRRRLPRNSNTNTWTVSYVANGFILLKTRSSAPEHAKKSWVRS